MSLWPCSAKAAQALRPRSAFQRQSLLIAHRLLSSSPEQSQVNLTALKQSVYSIRTEFNNAMKQQNAEGVASALSTFRMTVLKAPEGDQRRVIQDALRLEGGSLTKAIDLLSKSPTDSRSSILELIFRESESIFGLPQSSALLETVLNALVQSGESGRAYQIIKSFDKRGHTTASLYPNGRHWLRVMEGFAQDGDISSLELCVSWMHHRFPFPDNSHYRTLLEGMINADSINPHNVLKILDDMYHSGLPYDGGVHETFTRLMKKDALVFTQLDYERRFKHPKRNLRPTVATVDKWITELCTARDRARSAFEDKFRYLRKKGFIPGPSVLSKIVKRRNVSTVDELRYLSFCLGTEIDLFSWTSCLHHTLEGQGWQAALKTYVETKKAGVPPDARMLDRIIRAMLRVPLKQLSDELIDQIVMLVNDLGDRADLAIYNLALHALASSSNESKHFPVAMDLLKRMEKRGIKMDVMAATSAAQVLIRSASSFEEAKAAYEEIRNVSDPPLDLIGYRAVLSAFCKVELRVESMDVKTTAKEQVEYEGMRLSIPPASTYFEIVKDMRDRGYFISSHEYGILIARYAMLATRARALKDPMQRVSILDAIRSDIEETHRRISVDAGLELDGRLMNRLMDAYNRVDSVGDALRMWTLLVTSEKLTPASISIVFDTCGHSRSLARADAVFAEIKRLGVKLNVWNWNAWVECLCRLHRPVEAATVVRKEMPANGISPNEETWRVLKSFGIKVEGFGNFPPSAMASLDAFRRTAPRPLNDRH